MTADAAEPRFTRWWETAVVYQIYPRSFSDGNGDGVGDLRGAIERLPYLASLQVDAIWITPWYASPLKDGGYDVADYRRIHEDFGTLEDAVELIAAAKQHGIRTILDIVPNHVSSEHPWFRQALAEGRGGASRSRFLFHPGRGADGNEPPTHWKNNFAGPVWTRTAEPDGSPGDWYLHLFDSSQPDLNWADPEVAREHEAVLRFWFDRGAAGFRIDSAAHILKDPDFPEEHDGTPGRHPNLDRDGIHDVYRRWREIADEYAEPRVLVGEVWLPDAERFAAYLGPEEMHTAFNFDLMGRPWAADAFRASIDLMLGVHELADAPATWVLSNHDVTRPATRYGRADTAFSFDDKRWGVATDLALGTRRARAAAVIVAALPGSLYLYQGDELGLPEVEDLPHELLQDPMFHRSDGENPGRDGCRVPLPWSGDAPPFGFSPAGTRTWLPQPESWNRLTVERQEADPDSMLTLYRRLLGVRRETAAFRSRTMSWDETLGDGALAFWRDGSILCLANFGPAPLPLPDGMAVLVASDPTVRRGGVLPPDSAVWLIRD